MDQAFDDLHQLILREEWPRALPGLLQLTRAQPENQNAQLWLAIALNRTGQRKQAIAALRELVDKAPTNYAYRITLADTLFDDGTLDQAEQAYKQALNLDPGQVAAYNNLGTLYRELARYDEAIKIYERAHQLEPHNPTLLRNLALSLMYENRTEEATLRSEQALKLAPDSLVFQWTDARIMPILYQTQNQISFYRERYKQRLAHARDHLDVSTPEHIRSAESAIWDAFHIAYQGQDDVELARIHGGLIHDVMQALVPRPDLLVQQPERKRSKNDRIRVGFVSSWLRNSTISVLFRGWMEQLDVERFEAFGYQLGPFVDQVTDEIAQTCETFRHLQGDAISFARVIAADKLDVILYPELGMDRVTQRLAALRLAPVQCVTWGHPITTGLPTIDAFLTSDLMETPAASQHYTEKLVRLPNLSLYLDEPDVPEPTLSREDFGLSAEDFVYFIPHSFFKLLPQDDAIYARIAARVPGARFVFLANAASQTTKGVRITLELRLQQAFSALDLHWKDFVHILPGLTYPHFLDLNHCCDAYIDVPGWSGGRTALDAVSCGLLPITLPGKMMRQRHTAAILTRMGMTETIASSPEAYIDLAVCAATDQAWWNGLKQQLLERRKKLYGDRESVEALEAFLEQSVSGAS